VPDAARRAEGGLTVPIWIPVLGFPASAGVALGGLYVLLSR